MGVPEGSTGVYITRDELVNYEVNITTYAETVGIVVLCRTEVDEVFSAVVVDVRVEVGTGTTTLYLQRCFRTVVNLTDILV